jgi:MarR family transcriptional regulator, lower aerobic nicotinate degradation pathway regulator
MSTLKRVADRPTWLLDRANARAQAIRADAFARAGVRGYHFRLLAALEQYGPSSQAELGRAAGVDRSDVVATLDDLAHWGLASRTPDSADRRRNIVTITDAGAARLDELDAILADVQDAVLEPLTVRERSTLLRLLRRLA